ncbi:Transcriptional regulatory protein UhpA [Kordia antarctica]|uniref:Transcriptional regulatory protein UhpA n=1 Tax=Kordia antarctica TaxID=1218801 RepID=A0A7L4ZIU6_9FLAO|nr:response regulator transcription factor [Kordia antarctica]QHI36407.1 Transcriptional regulatory protein UhpA [Kordia antarctica]
MKSSLTIMIIDDSILFSEGLEQLLMYNSLVKNVISCHNYEQAAKNLENSIVDIILLDLNFETNEYDGFSIAKLIRERYPKIKIIILTQHAKVDYYETLIEDYNLDGYVDKQLSAKNVFDAIQEVFKGNKYVDKNITKMLLLGKWLKLSKRENEVIELISKGITQKETALELYISPKTVESHLKNLCERFNVKNSVELINTYTNYKKSNRENYEKTTAPFQQRKIE